MYRKVTLYILIMVILLNLTSCGSNKKTRYEAEFLELFDTMTKIVAYTDNKDEFTRYSQLIYDNLKEYHELYDIYNNYPGINNIKTINDNAGVMPVKVDQRIIDLLLFSKDWNKKTDGKVNIAFGSVLSIWHKYREAGIEDESVAELPPMEDLKKAEKHTDINKLIIDEKNSMVFLEDPDMSLDVGAVAKGYAVEQVSQIAMKNGFNSGLISVGGNIRAIGNNSATNQLWNLGIQNPDLESKEQNLKVLAVADSSLVTSGIYERYYTVDQKQYHHIIDPDTLFPAEYFMAVTILTKDSGIADALSTSVFNMPFEKGIEFIESLPNTEALWVMNNGEIKYSASFKKYIIE